jgi:hypothetical protein
MKRWLAIVLSLVVGYAVGAVAQRRATGATMTGTVMDANTLAEEIEYWELRSPAGGSVVIVGRKDLPVIRWLRQAKGKSAVLSIDASDQVSPLR